MHRFFLPPDSFTGPRIRIAGDVAAQMRRVLRMRPGDPLTLLDGHGYQYQATLCSYGKDEAWADLLERTFVAAEPRVRVDLYLSILNKPDKFEWALQKCTELGAACFVPVIAERSVADRLSDTRHERWVRIIREAAEQSSRGVIPQLAIVMTFKEAVDREARRIESQGRGGHIALIPEVGQSRTLRDALGSHPTDRSSASLFIGPEGGFTPAEVSAALDAGIAAVSLGPRILRAETAAVASLALLMNSLGEM